MSAKRPNTDQHSWTQLDRYYVQPLDRPKYAIWIGLKSDLFSQGIALSIISYMEVYEGVYYGNHPEQNKKVFRRFVRGLGLSDPLLKWARFFVGTCE